MARGVKVNIVMQYNNRGRNTLEDCKLQPNRTLSWQEFQCSTDALITAYGSTLGYTRAYRRLR